jgi:hypothetical protein
MSSHVPTNIHFCMLYYNVCIYIYIYIYVCGCVCFHISVMLFIHEAILNILKNEMQISDVKYCLLKQWQSALI